MKEKCSERCDWPNCTKEDCVAKHQNPLGYDDWELYTPEQKGKELDYADDWHIKFNEQLKKIVTEFYFWFQTVRSDAVSENYDYWSEGPAHGWKLIVELIQMATKSDDTSGWKAIAETNAEQHKIAYDTIYALQAREKEMWKAIGDFCAAIERQRRPS